MQNNPGQTQTRGKHRNNAYISTTFSESRIANSRWGICSGEKRLQNVIKNRKFRILRLKELLGRTMK